MIFYDQVIPGSTLVGYLNADHWALAVPINRTHDTIASLFVTQNAYPREALLEALLRFVEEDLARGRVRAGVSPGPRDSVTLSWPPGSCKSFLRRHKAAAFAAALVLFAVAGVALAPWWIDLGPVRAEDRESRVLGARGHADVRADGPLVAPAPRGRRPFREGGPAREPERNRTVSCASRPRSWPLLRGRVVLTKLRRGRTGPGGDGGSVEGSRDPLSSSGSRLEAVSLLAGLPDAGRLRRSRAAWFCRARGGGALRWKACASTRHSAPRTEGPCSRSPVSPWTPRGSSSKDLFSRTRPLRASTLPRTGAPST